MHIRLSTLTPINKSNKFSNQLKIVNYLNNIRFRKNCKKYCCALFRHKSKCAKNATTVQNYEVQPANNEVHATALKGLLCT